MVQPRCEAWRTARRCGNGRRRRRRLCARSRHGQFLWATPFPYDTPEFLISKIDGKTGKVYLNESLIFKQPKEEHLICFFNTRSYWPTAYSPETNSLYVPFTDTCLDNVEGGKRATA